MNSTYLPWGDEFYEQIHRLPMGSSLSPILTEIYITELEEKALQTATVKPTCWYRKVYDTFVILQPDHDPTQLLIHLNNQHPCIKCTMESEQNKKLPFLDVLVSLTSSNHLQTTVYRKPSHSDQYMQYNSKYAG
ncbi:uncharacterized protein LOC124292190 [Haliotis rubra]|uniref:uncharacterized protein LOC124292190 n=1 Tax=Haliotis rubra TaxID=36100 RepID=UPI001EE57E00|nr:uncharacterized protein LOC124292190 [Haliotis rubra]